MTPYEPPAGFIGARCHRCTNEVYVRTDHEGPVVCEHCSPTALASLGEAMRIAKERREQAEAKRQDEFVARLQRIGGKALERIRPGAPSSARCPGCHQHYVYDDRLFQVHPGGICPGAPSRSKAVAAPIEIPRVRRVRNIFRDDDDDYAEDAA